MLEQGELTTMAAQPGCLLCFDKELTTIALFF